MTLAFQGVEKVYPNGFRAVSHLDLQIQDGEFFTLLGPSGCGKTTTLRMVAGLETPTAGRVLIGGKDFTHTHPRDRDIAMVFQSYALYPHMTVRENLVLNLQVRRVATADIERRLLEIVRMLGIDHLLDSKPARLSGGQRQRVALGRALIRRPNVFLMDEPLSNLDLKLRERTRTELKKLHEKMRVTTVYVTHDQAEALVLSDRICIMNAGEVQQVGTPQEVYDRPANTFVAKFVGTPSVNLLAIVASATDGMLHLSLAKGGQKLNGASLPVTQEVLQRLEPTRGHAILGVRPESIALHNELVPDSILGNVELVEPMGSVNHIVLSLNGSDEVTVDGEPFIAMVRSNEGFEHGQPTFISLRPDRLVLFDQESGLAIAVLSLSRQWRVAG